MSAYPCRECDTKTTHRKNEDGLPACVVCRTVYHTPDREIEDAGQASIFPDPSTVIVS